jgi:UDP-D-galactose:(glucosyl)LPS alpha-1,6-D-galactosyltransferase
MKVAFFCPTVSGTGGVESATRNLMAGFRALGDQTHLFLFGGSFDQGWLQGLAYTRIGSPQDARLLRITKYAVGAIKAVAGWRPDVIICSDVTTLQMARLGRRLSLRPQIKIASWIHYPLAKVRMKEQLHQADLHLAISGEIAEDLQAYLPQQRDRIFTIYNAVDIDQAHFIPRPQSASFLYVGRLTYDGQKRVNDLLQAVARLQGNWKLKIIGAPPKGEEHHAQRLTALATELRLDDRVQWLGWQKNAWDVAGETTALVMPSGHEGFPMVLLEAAAHGIVCISSDCKSGPSEIIETGKNGWLYPVADLDKLTALLQQRVDAPHDLPTQDVVRGTAARFAAPAIAQRARQGILKITAAS